MTTNLKRTLLCVVGGGIILGLACTLGAAVSGTQNLAAWAALANVLILGATAVVVVYYTEETRRMAESTGVMARAARDTLDHALKLLSCELDVRRHGGARDHSDLIVTNQGPGQAFRVRVSQAEIDSETPYLGSLPAGESRQLNKTRSGWLEIKAQDAVGRPCGGRWECGPDHENWHRVED